MKAMILAAGRGERMRPLTDNCPKPLLKVKGVALIEHHIKNLVAAGIKDIVINHAWLGQQLVDYLGCGKQLSANISYSEETLALETAGGIIKALPLLAEQDDEIFLVINGDIYCDFNFTHLPILSSKYSAHLILVTNPEHNLNGDFQLESGVLVNPKGNKQNTYTFSGIALYRKSFFKQFFKQHSATKYDNVMSQGAVQPLAPMLRAAADQQQVSASVMHSAWTDVGTPERLAKLNTI
ncbi:nucleotidyltransferase family protein [Colwellia sp. M166]|mgnify:FL=1|uniref:N-acetylmuramate alpha-1-phosphate uridylyltransferase MurU n=1 Tax=Colwellia sp. M166 TaxID=2583805 RepID=UPI00211EC9FA|nr:nucleotidyltransferase family protein [Colwellia sp. M166]UUO24440.1 nucleotidyltransferase family protein [Colwellia sp. M166]|tara:strand:+ start:3696 stop:4409 length:714 start_codon:yes stop_codon:yes gene_type:complete